MITDPAIAETPLTAPTLSSPSDGSDQPGTAITFTWNASPGNSNYDLEVIRPSGTRFFDKWVGNVLTYTVSGFPIDGSKFLWRVYAYDPNLVKYPRSETWSFTNGSWINVCENATFGIRDTAEGAVFQGKMWLSNGYYYGNTSIRDLWNSSDGLTWTKVLDETPYDEYSEMVTFKGKLWAIKGSVWNSADGVEWVQILEHTPFGWKLTWKPIRTLFGISFSIPVVSPYNIRPYGEVVSFKDELWQLGSGPDVWHSEDGVKWTCAVEKAPFGQRFASAVAVYNGKLWLCGGAVEGVPGDSPWKGYPYFTTYNDVWCSEDGINWTRVMDHAPWAERMWFPAREYAGKLWILGGFSNRNGVNLADCWTTTDGVNWEEYKSNQIWSPRHEQTVYIFKNSLWVVAGNSWPLMNDVWKMTLPQPSQ